MTSFTEDMRRRGMVPGSRTLDLHVSPAGPHLGRLLHVSPSEPVVVIKRVRLADHETMAIETLHVRESLVPGLTASGPGAALVLRHPPGAVRDRDRRRAPDDRADGDERGGVRGARRPAALAGLPLRADDPFRNRRDRRVRPLDVPWRPLQARDGAQPERLEPRPDRLGVAALAADFLVGQYHAAHARRTSSRVEWLFSMQKARKSGLDNLGDVCEGSDPVTKWYKPVDGRRHSGAIAGQGTGKRVRPSLDLVGRTPMRVRSIGAVVLVGVILAAVASTASGAPTAQSATLTVWLQVDAQAANWEPIVKAANAQFQKRPSRRHGQRPVPDVGQPPPEARRIARGRQRSRRDRDG